MAIRIAILVVLVFAVSLLWPSKVRAFLGAAGIVAVLAALGFLIVMLINLPAPQ